ncbi:MAG: hypothetical protein P1U56_08085 [Saprospiraceae bacterium]|nr:hypothetical protein [Saprospiraceae bacterium]
MDDSIKIPTFLHEIHGKKSNWLDILTTHGLALLTIAVVSFQLKDLGLPSWKEWVLIALAYDLAGGVVANMSYSRQQFYLSTKRRIIFLSLHFLQPLFLCWVFPEEAIAIGTFSGYTVFSAFIVNAVSDFQNQRIMGILLSLIGIIALCSVPVKWEESLLLLLTLFLLKLPFSFAVRWHNHKTDEVLE